MASSVNFCQGRKAGTLKTIDSDVIFLALFRVSNTPGTLETAIAVQNENLEQADIEITRIRN
jgi:hypothetical protein